MNGYQDFARYYDALTSNVDYPAMAERLDALIRAYGNGGKILLDVACGTGTLCGALAARGYDVIGADRSPEMLNVAFEKKLESGLDIQYICQDMTNLNLYGGADAVISTLDSFNHLNGFAQLDKTFGRIVRFCNPGAVFLFDMNTCYKHDSILAGHSFVYETDAVFCAWQNAAEQAHTVRVLLDFFVKEENGYQRFSEEFTETAYPAAEIEALLARHGFAVIGQFDGYTAAPLCETSERVLFVSKKR
ncbi:MAG: methyltransferase domain-containing protein [Oscillospiraceae bacterium]